MAGTKASILQVQCEVYMAAGQLPHRCKASSWQQALWLLRSCSSCGSMRSQRASVQRESLGSKRIPFKSFRAFSEGWGLGGSTERCMDAATRPATYDSLLTFQKNLSANIHSEQTRVLLISSCCDNVKKDNVSSVNYSTSFVTE